MAFNTTVYSDLSAKYSNWDALRMFLTSEDGGKLRVVTNENDDLAIIRYTKGMSDFEKTHVPYFRSVLWNKTTNLPVSVAPIKALKGNPPADTPVRITDFVDGTMFHAFRYNNRIRIATRTSLDATGTFYSSRSFCELFEDAFKSLGGKMSFLESVLTEDGDFVSFVLQHPEHKTVASLAGPNFVATYFGKVTGSDVWMSSSPCSSHPVWPARLVSYAPHVFEETHTFENSDDAFQMMRSKATAMGYSWQGMVFQGSDGRRWRLRNAAYVAVRTLRGSEANPMDRFVRLRSQGQVKKYLDYFREEANTMWVFEQTLRKRTQELYDSYRDMNKLKTKTMKDLPYCLRPHVYALHGMYLAGLPKDGTRKESVTPILKDAVVKYVNNLPSEEQLKLLQGDRVTSTA